MSNKYQVKKIQGGALHSAKENGTTMCSTLHRGIDLLFLLLQSDSRNRRNIRFELSEWMLGRHVVCGFHSNRSSLTTANTIWTNNNERVQMALTSDTVENLLKSYARRRELLKKSHYFGMSFPAIIPSRSAITRQQQTVEVGNETSETTQHFIQSTQILPLPKRCSITALPERIRRNSYSQSRKPSAQLKLKKTEKSIELEPTIEPTVNTFKHTLELHRCRVDSFQHLEEISQLRNLQNILIGSSGNAITQLSCWYLFLVHRMSHLSLRNINGIKITPELCSLAAHKFGSCVQLLRLSRKQRQIMDKQTFPQEIEATSEDENHRVNCRLICAVNQIENVVIQDAASKFVDQMMTNSLDSYKRNKQFHQIWPHHFSQAVIETIETFKKGIDFNVFIGEKNLKTDDE
uniref:Uncharacterized protein n=1 Tax=Strigamia maritima TaxID=126957 RepID=T1JHI3_STRMM